MKIYKNCLLIGFNQKREIMIAPVKDFSSIWMRNTYTNCGIDTRQLVDKNKVLKGKLLGLEGYDIEKITLDSTEENTEFIYSVELKYKVDWVEDVFKCIDISKHCSLFNTIAIVPIMGTYSTHEEIPLYIEELTEEDICNRTQSMDEKESLMIYNQEWGTFIGEYEGPTSWISVVAYNKR